MNDGDEPAHAGATAVETLQQLTEAARARQGDPAVDDARDRESELLAAEWEARIPHRFRHARLDDVRGEPGQLLADWLTAADETNVLIAGATGTGKTHAAVALLRELHFGFCSVAFEPVVELLDALRPGAADDPARLARARQVQYLVLDDLGAERATDWTHERLYSIVNRRWLEERVTIVTTNVPVEGLADAWEPRLFSRIAHDVLSLRLSGEDRRRT